MKTVYVVLKLFIKKDFWNLFKYYTILLLYFLPISDKSGGEIDSKSTKNYFKIVPKNYSKVHHSFTKKVESRVKKKMNFLYWLLRAQKKRNN